MLVCLYTLSMGVKKCFHLQLSLNSPDFASSCSYISVQIAVFAVAAVVLTGVVHILLPTGYFGPVSARVRGLFLKHTRTGNPLVDSVAEHQPSSMIFQFSLFTNFTSFFTYLGPETYQFFLHHSYYTTLAGFGLLVLYYPKWYVFFFLHCPLLLFIHFY